MDTCSAHHRWSDPALGLASQPLDTACPSLQELGRARLCTLALTPVHGLPCVRAELDWTGRRYPALLAPQKDLRSFPW
ncbi:hypothetical protein F751_5504 [Auxenochlorella protothecoides]|uniref:Uncharacterized protein n=1 Tax=Auxenochlorella protothecoides TaxID=3075 RepID=A0A087STU4_AUXPR|nr:hypothetical protein F751_5504 [Auxenochlorella protothecoides]KFM29148.1 hypothetical protein F751_5504 [Auxenochlorella protothecoides]